MDVCVYVLHSSAVDLRRVFVSPKLSLCCKREKKNGWSLTQAENVAQAEVMATANHMTPG